MCALAHRQPRATSSSSAASSSASGCRIAIWPAATTIRSIPTRWRGCARIPRSARRCTIIARESTPACWRWRSRKAGRSSGYERPEHPVQQLVRRPVAELCGAGAGGTSVAVDGCSVPRVRRCRSRPWRASYARLASARADGDARERALARIRSAMRASPARDRRRGAASHRSSWRRRADARRQGRRRGARVRRSARARAGTRGQVSRTAPTRAVGPAVIALLDHLGVLSDAERARLQALRSPRLRNVAGLEVGRIEAGVRAWSSRRPDEWPMGRTGETGSCLTVRASCTAS